MKNTNPGVMSHLNVMLRRMSFHSNKDILNTVSFFIISFFFNYDESVSYQICSFNNTGTQDPVVYVIQTPEVVVLEHLLKIKVV